MTTSSQKRAARDRSIRTGETYQTALWRNRDIDRFASHLEALEAMGFSVLTDDDKRALWRGGSVSIDPEQKWSFKWMFAQIERWAEGTMGPGEKAQLAEALPWIFGEETIWGFINPFGMMLPIEGEVR